jgi:hypothetical protein
MSKKKKRHRRSVHAALSRKRGIGFPVGLKFFGAIHRTGGPGSGLPGTQLLGADGIALTGADGALLTGI